MKTIRALILLGAALLAPAAPALAGTETTFTYQGRLDFEGSPYTGAADYRFTLWDAATDGGQIGGDAVVVGVEVEAGLFSAGIDFGAAAHGPGRFLQIEVRTPAWDGQGAEPPYFMFPERVPLTPAPYALRTRGIFVNEAGDRVGIGTDDPKQRLHNTGDYYGRGHLWFHAIEGDGNSGTSYLQARDDSGTSSIAMRLRSQQNGVIREAVHIAPDGSVGVGTLNPLSRLHVAGTVRASGVQFNDGSVISRSQIVASRTNALIDFGPISGGGRSAVSGALTGAMPGDVVIVSVDGDIPFPFILFGANCPAPNQFRALFHNVGSSTADPPAITFSVIAIRP